MAQFGAALGVLAQTSKCANYNTAAIYYSSSNINNSKNENGNDTKDNAAS